METKQSYHLILSVAQIVSWCISLCFFVLTCLLGYKIGLVFKDQLNNILTTSLISLIISIALLLIIIYPVKKTPQVIKSFLKFYLYTLLFFVASWLLGYFYPLAGNLNFLNFLKLNSHHTFSFTFVLMGGLIGLFWIHKKQIS